MLAPVLYEGLATSGFMLSEAAGLRSRGSGVFSNAGNSNPLVVAAGTVFSVSAFGAPLSTPATGNTGNGVMGNLSVNANFAFFGNYTLTMLTPTTFSMLDPNGDRLSDGTVGTPYNDGIGFTLSAGSAPFASGDAFTIGVPAGTGLLVPYAGSAPAAGIIWAICTIPAGGTLPVTTIVREAEVRLSRLVWAPGVTTPQQSAALARLASQGIIARQ
jgi:hypothetical protein